MALTEEQKRRIEMEERVRSNQYSTPTNNQKHGFPAFLSLFIPGLGQMVKGQILRGVIILFAVPVGLLIFIIPGIIIYIWQIIDAYNKN